MILREAVRVLRATRGLFLLVGSLLFAGCSLLDPAPPPATPVPATPTVALATPTPVNPVLVGAGDIGDCGSRRPQQTADLLAAIPGTIFTTGDNGYDNGTATDFQQCYDPSWGPLKARTRPAPGDHDYITAQGAAYYAYFGANAGPSGLGYYSYELGAWHIVSLNSNIPADPASAQAQWLEADLTTHPAACTLAYWHEPLYTSGFHQDDPHMRDIWRVLYQHKADVVLNGHDHDYERFAPQNAENDPDPARGIREFVVGTGGASLRDFAKIRPNSEVRDSITWGVIKLTLHPTSYDWQFIPIQMDGQTFHDSGRGACVL